MLVLLADAIKYKPYHSRLLGVLFFSLLRTVAEPSDDMKAVWLACCESIPSHAFVLFAPKIFMLLSRALPSEKFKI